MRRLLLSLFSVPCAAEIFGAPSADEYFLSLADRLKEAIFKVNNRDNPFLYHASTKALTDVGRQAMYRETYALQYYPRTSHLEISANAMILSKVSAQRVLDWAYAEGDGYDEKEWTKVARRVIQEHSLLHGVVRTDAERTEEGDPDLTNVDEGGRPKEEVPRVLSFSFVRPAKPVLRVFPESGEDGDGVSPTPKRVSFFHAETVLYMNFLHNTLLPSLQGADISSAMQGVEDALREAKEESLGGTPQDHNAPLLKMNENIKVGGYVATSALSDRIAKLLGRTPGGTKDLRQIYVSKIYVSKPPCHLCKQLPRARAQKILGWFVRKNLLPRGGEDGTKTEIQQFLQKNTQLRRGVEAAMKEALETHLPPEFMAPQKQGSSFQTEGENWFFPHVVRKSEPKTVFLEDRAGAAAPAPARDRAKATSVQMQNRFAPLEITVVGSEGDLDLPQMRPAEAGASAEVPQPAFTVAAKTKGKKGKNKGNLAAAASKKEEDEQEDFDALLAEYRSDYDDYYAGDDRVLEEQKQKLGGRMALRVKAIESFLAEVRALLGTLAERGEGGLGGGSAEQMDLTAAFAGRRTVRKRIDDEFVGVFRRRDMLPVLFSLRLTMLLGKEAFGDLPKEWPQRLKMVWSPVDPKAAEDPEHVREQINGFLRTGKSLVIGATDDEIAEFLTEQLLNVVSRVHTELLAAKQGGKGNSRMSTEVKDVRMLVLNILKSDRNFRHVARLLDMVYQFRIRDLRTRCGRMFELQTWGEYNREVDSNPMGSKDSPLQLKNAVWFWEKHLSEVSMLRNLDTMFPDDLKSEYQNLSLKQRESRFSDRWRNFENFDYWPLLVKLRVPSYAQLRDAYEGALLKFEASYDFRQPAAEAALGAAGVTAAAEAHWVLALTNSVFRLEPKASVTFMEVQSDESEGSRKAIHFEYRALVQARLARRDQEAGLPAAASARTLLFPDEVAKRRLTVRAECQPPPPPETASWWPRPARSLFARLRGSRSSASEQPGPDPVVEAPWPGALAVRRSDSSALVLPPAKTANAQQGKINPPYLPGVSIISPEEVDSVIAEDLVRTAVTELAIGRSSFTDPWLPTPMGTLETRLLHLRRLSVLDDTMAEATVAYRQIERQMLRRVLGTAYQDCFDTDRANAPWSKDKMQNGLSKEAADFWLRGLQIESVGGRRDRREDSMEQEENQDKVVAKYNDAVAGLVKVLFDDYATAKAKQKQADKKEKGRSPQPFDWLRKAMQEAQGVARALSAFQEASDAAISAGLRGTSKTSLFTDRIGELFTADSPTSTKTNEAAGISGGSRSFMASASGGAAKPPATVEDEDESMLLPSPVGTSRRPLDKEELRKTIGEEYALGLGEDNVPDDVESVSISLQRLLAGSGLPVPESLQLAAEQDRVTIREKDRESHRRMQHDIAAKLESHNRKTLKKRLAQALSLKLIIDGLSDLASAGRDLRIGLGPLASDFDPLEEICGSLSQDSPEFREALVQAGLWLGETEDERSRFLKGGDPDEQLHRLIDVVADNFSVLTDQSLERALGAPKSVFLSDDDDDEDTIARGLGLINSAKLEGGADEEEVAAAKPSARLLLANVRRKTQGEERELLSLGREQRAMALWAESEIPGEDAAEDRRAPVIAFAAPEAGHNNPAGVITYTPPRRDADVTIAVRAGDGPAAGATQLLTVMNFAIQFWGHAQRLREERDYLYTYLHSDLNPVGRHLESLMEGFAHFNIGQNRDELFLGEIARLRKLTLAERDHLAALVGNAHMEVVATSEDRSASLTPILAEAPEPGPGKAKKKGKAKPKKKTDRDDEFEFLEDEIRKNQAETKKLEEEARKAAALAEATRRRDWEAEDAQRRANVLPLSVRCQKRHEEVRDWLDKEFAPAWREFRDVLLPVVRAASSGPECSQQQPAGFGEEHEEALQKGLALLQNVRRLPVDTALVQNIELKMDLAAGTLS
eukprot:g10859.t1